MPFLGVFCDRSADELVWEQRFSEFELAFLSNHRVGTVKLLPGTCYIEMARAMVRQQHGEACFALTNVRFQTILFLDEAELRGPPTVRVRLHPTRQEVSIMSRFDDGAWAGAGAQGEHAHACRVRHQAGLTRLRLHHAM